MTAPISGLSIATDAMRGAERRLAVVANNLANVSTDGYKAERAFAHLLDAAQGAPTVATRADLRQGTLRETGAPLDVALGNEGFLVAATPQGERWVRGGSLTVDGAGRLTLGGVPLLAEAGAVRIAPGHQSIALQPDGTVLVDGRLAGRLRVERPVDPAAVLAREPQGTFIPADARQSIPPAERTLRQGALEASNVEPVSTMVELLGIQRHHGLLERAVRVLDETRGTAASQLGRPV